MLHQMFVASNLCENNVMLTVSSKCCVFLLEKFLVPYIVVICPSKTAVSKGNQVSQK